MASGFGKKSFLFTTQVLFFKKNGFNLLHNFSYSVVKIFKLAFNYFFTLSIAHQETYPQGITSNYGKQLSDIIINPTSGVRNHYKMI
jgi:hypothetical protein